MKGIRSAIYVILGGAAVVLISLLAASFTKRTDHYDPSLAAAWVQAVGSIAAIVGALFVGERQSFAARKALEEEREAAITARLACYIAIAEVASEATARAAEVFPITLEVPELTPESKLRRLPVMSYNPALLNEAVDNLRLIRIDELGSAEAIKEFGRLRSTVMLVHAVQRTLEDFGVFTVAYAMGIRVSDIPLHEKDALVRKSEYAGRTVGLHLNELKSLLNLEAVPSNKRKTG